MCIYKCVPGDTIIKYMSCHDMLRHIMSRHVTLRHVMFCYSQLEALHYIKAPNFNLYCIKYILKVNTVIVRSLQTVATSPLDVFFTFMMR